MSNGPPPVATENPGKFDAGAAFNRGGKKAQLPVGYMAIMPGLPQKNQDQQTCAFGCDPAAGSLLFFKGSL